MWSGKIFAGISGPRKWNLLHREASYEEEKALLFPAAVVLLRDVLGMEAQGPQLQIGTILKLQPAQDGGLASVSLRCLGGHGFLLGLSDLFGVSDKGYKARIAMQ
jgi:hypothetical protein